MIGESIVKRKLTGRELLVVASFPAACSCFALPFRCGNDAYRVDAVGMKIIPGTQGEDF